MYSAEQSIGMYKEFITKLLEEKINLTLAAMDTTFSCLCISMH